MVLTQYRASHTRSLFRFFAVSISFIAVLAMGQLALAESTRPVQFFFVPLPEDQLLTSLTSMFPQDLCDSENADPADPVTTYISLVASLEQHDPVLRPLGRWLRDGCHQSGAKQHRNLGRRPARKRCSPWLPKRCDSCRRCDHPQE